MSPDNVFDYWSWIITSGESRDPFADDVFIQSTVEDIGIHFRTTTAINDLVDGIVAFAVVPSLTQGNIQVQFEMTQAGEVSIDLFTMTGLLAGNLSNGYQPAGEHSLSYNLQ